MRNVAFGQYYPTGSFIHKLDPRTKLFAGIVFIAAAFVADSYWAYLACYAFLIFVILVSKIPIFQVLKTIKSIFFIVLLSVALNVFFHHEGKVLWSWWKIRITVGGLLYSGQIILRLMFLVLSTSLITLTSTPTELTDGLEKIMTPLKYLRFPVHDVAIIMSIALRFIPTLMEETDKITMAQKARGAKFDTGGPFARAKALLPVLIPLFVSAFRRADELALALDARCYNATDARTKMKILRFGWKDLTALLFLALFMTVIVFFRLGFFGLL